MRLASYRPSQDVTRAELDRVRAILREGPGEC